MNFTAIDFETAHANFPCEIGLTKVENNQIVEYKSWLIKPACYPYMNPWNLKVHHISSSDVQNAPDFENLWSEIKPWFEDEYLVAHNAAFDMKVLRSALAYYDLAVPDMEYFCSVSLSRKAWKELPSHSLGTLSEFHNIRFQHHRAGDDAKACAMIALKALEKLDIKEVREINRAGVKLHKLRV